MDTDIYNRSVFDMIEQVNKNKLSAPFIGSEWTRTEWCGSSCTISFQITYISESTEFVTVLILFLTIKLLQNSLSHAVKYSFSRELPRRCIN